MKIKSFKAFQDTMLKKNKMCYVEAQYSGSNRIISGICVNVCSGNVIAVYVAGKGIVWEANKAYVTIDMSK